MSKTFILKIVKSITCNAKAEKTRFVKSYDKSAKAEVKAFTPEMESYYDHLMEWSV